MSNVYSFAFPRELVNEQSVSVAPTETTLAEVKVEGNQNVSVHITNEDASQVLACAIYRKATSGMDYAPASAVSDLDSIQPGDSRMVDFDVAGSQTLKVTGTASGAGLTATVSVVAT